MKNRRKIVISWLILVLFSVVIQIILGGYVRLTDSGLSMYDWHVVKGVIPPLSDAEWQDTFKNYKHTPEYKKINVGMTLAEYKLIYIREYNHRIIGRLTGLIFVIPLFIFLFSGWFKWKTSKIYLVTGLLYAGQGVLGWYMVKSGLVDHPHVSHYRLAAHFILALLILSFVLWKLLDILNGDQNMDSQSFKDKTFKILIFFKAILFIQICYGAFIAGLDAGLVSDTFPLMFGFLIPPNLYIKEIPGLLNLFENPAMVHFIHRWLAFVVLGFSIYTWITLKKKIKVAYLLPVFVLVQIVFGLLVIWFHVPVSLALFHQMGAVIIVLATVFLLHHYLEKENLAS